MLKLAIAFLREHPVRGVLTSIATIAAACMVIWVVSGYEALLSTFDEFSNKALGRYSLSVAPISVVPGRSVPAAVAKELRADPAVSAVDPMWAQQIVLTSGPSVSRADAIPPQIMLLGTDAPQPPFAISRGRWLDPRRPDALEAAVSADMAKRLGVDVGGELFTGKGEKACRIHVIGIVDAPPSPSVGLDMVTLQLPSPSVGGIYVSMAAAERVLGRRSSISFLGVCLKPEADINRFRFAWAPRLNRFSTPVQFQEAYDLEEALDDSASADNMRLQAYAVTGIAMLVAFLVVFGTLSMGVTERVRQFALLRAVVLTRSQVGLLIVLEGLLLASIGFLGGLALSKSLLCLAANAAPRLLRHGAAVGASSVLFAALATYGGALLAALIPAYRATRVRPLDAIAPRPPSSPAAQGGSVPLVLAGGLLVAVNPLLTFVFPPGFEGRVGRSMLLGFVAMAAGFLLLTPAIVAAVNRLAGPLLARCLGLDAKLLTHQISANLWRSVGSAVALSVGLGLYIAIHVWGFTMLDSFLPGTWAPDALLAFNPNGIAPEHAAEVAHFPGVDAQRCLPLVVEQPRLLEDLTHSAQRASITRQDNVVIVGLDPERALDGAHPLLKLEWAEGNPERAIASLKKGRACLVPDHFLRETGLKVGDGFDLVPPDDSDHPVRYTIAGAVRLHGWHWQTKLTGFRSRTHRAAALVFSDYACVAKDFGLPTATHVWFCCTTPCVDIGRLAAAAQSLYSKALGRDVGIDSAPGNAPFIRVMPIEGVRNIVRGHAKQWIWAMSILPLITLIISSAGVLNVIIASVRARRWEMGILRAIGFTRATLVRLVIAESLLVGFVACVLSLGFGVLAGWCGIGISQYISFFGGLHPPLFIPWLQVTCGLLAVLGVSALTAAWPAISTARVAPLRLLQEGRSAT
jgi:putative ABC transport system permease protein